MKLHYRYRRRDGWLGLVLLIITLALAFGQQEMATHQPGLYSVAEFSDGDTVVVDMNGRRERVRFIGVDTPETHKPNTPVQCYGPAAAAYTKNLIGEQRLRLAADPLSTNRDRYDRLLRYAYLPNGTLINQQLIETGHGFYYPYFPFTKEKEFESAQQRAQAAHKGLWGNCQPTPTDGGGYVSNSLSTE